MLYSKVVYSAFKNVLCVFLIMELAFKMKTSGTKNISLFLEN